MSKQYLIESITVCLENPDEIRKRDDLYESLDNGRILVENKEVRCLGVYRTTISKIGEMNKNKRVYTESTWKEALTRGDGEGSLGLINHPAPQTSPNLHDVFCIWRNHKIEMNNENKPVVRSDMYILDNENGKLIESILAANGRVDLSTRGYGDLNEDGTVTGYQFVSIDGVYEGSFNVNFGKDEEIRDIVSESKTTVGQTKPQVTKTDKKPNISENMTTNHTIKTTNNKIETGETSMDKVVIKRLVNESFKKKNKFTAYKELKDIYEGISEDHKDIKEDIEKKMMKLEPMLEQEYQGDAEDNGSAEDPKARVHNATDPEKKIKDTDEKEPDDVDKTEINTPADTKDDERTGKTGIKAGSSPDAMTQEVKNGEVSSASQGIKEDVILDAVLPSYFLTEEEQNRFKRLWNRVKMNFRVSGRSFLTNINPINLLKNLGGEVNNILIYIANIGTAGNEKLNIDYSKLLKKVSDGDITKSRDFMIEWNKILKKNGFKPYETYEKIPSLGEIKTKLKQDGVAKPVTEDTNEYEPDDVKEVEVDDPKDTDKRTAYTDTKAGSGKDAENKEDEKDNSDVEKMEDIDLTKLSKSELIDVVNQMNEATIALQVDLDKEKKVYNTLAEQYLKLETYTMKAEDVVRMDKENKEKAQSEVVESVDYVKNLKEENDQLLQAIEEQQEYIEKLEENVLSRDKSDVNKSEVPEYVAELLASNPQLNPYKSHLMKADSINEAIEMAERFNSLRNKVRLDAVTRDSMVEASKDIDVSKEVNESNIYLKTKNWI